MPFVETGSYPARAGNRIVPWIDGEPAFRRICEAIELAHESVWATVTFMWPSFQMPDGRGAALDVLERAARRGVDVRLIFWRPDDETAGWRRNAFWGSAEHFELLSRRYPHVNIRWDRAHPGYCQHQKTWLIDADRDGGTSFVGGINLNPHSVVSSDHRGNHHNHDVYVEVTGPAVADVHHNFVQRWNEASERAQGDGRWGEGSVADLDFPEHQPPPCGTAVVQIQRTTHAERYTDGHPPPGGSPFPIALGERTIHDQYRVAIQAARRTIYLEHQYLEVAGIVSALEDALTRGVQIVAMLPAVPELTARADARTPALEARARLSRYDGFTLCGMAGLDTDGARKPVYVHSKLILVDDEWASVGSCNLHHHSLFGNGELNVACSDPASVRAMRIALFKEHLGVDTAELDGADALLLFRRIARDNRGRHDRNDPHWQGMAFSLDVATYGVTPQF
ncbi:MAG TPA: phosphatidylserine/phosphatidylglycerophosphate/cardiolipin synthase family protein [Longimicrobium sp.]|nr:phosphatidylserine/phosphatidylglycerophosphate/cardiolipin synthase family protein [Longimicrobium sp.]